MEDVHRLRVFLSVAENLSFTAAGRRLFLTQSAVSHQVSALEREIGTPLLIRRGKTISLTAAGQALVATGKKVFAALDEATESARNADRPDVGRLRIGASSAACQYIIPEALREFRESFPEYRLSIMPGDSPVVIENILNESIDLGLVIKPDQTSKLTFHDLFVDELGFVVSPLHEWAKAGKVDRRQIAGQRLVLYSRKSATFHLVDRYLSRIGAPLRDWIELGETGAIKELAKLGLGVTIMAKWIVAAEIAEKSLVYLPLPVGKLRRTWSVGVLSGRPLSVAEQTFVGLCQSVAAQLASAAIAR